MTWLFHFARIVPWHIEVTFNGQGHMIKRKRYCLIFQYLVFFKYQTDLLISQRSVSSEIPQKEF